MTPDQLGEVFRHNLVEIRKSKNLSQSELARKTGIAQPQISDLERGDTRPTTASIARIAAALEVPAWTLLFTAENAGVPG